MLREIKDKMLASEILGRLVRDRKPISYFYMLMVSIECVDRIFYWDETDAVAETLWHLFKDELVPIYSLVVVDREKYVESDPVGVPESLKRCFAEARELATIPIG